MELSDNDIVNFTLAGTLVMLLIVGFFVVFVLLYKRRQLEYENEKLRVQREFSEELLRTRNELGEQVLGKISDEIHDNIGQTLTLAKLRLGGLSSDNFEAGTEDAGVLISRSLRDLRDLSKSLNGDYIVRNGFYETLKQEGAFIERSGRITCAVEGVYPDGLIQPDSELILYRCVQEAMGNVLKHAHATDLRVELKKTDTEFEIRVSDNGDGIPDDWDDNGLGMMNMRKRMGLLGGQFSVLPGISGRGTSISLKLPLQTKTSTG